MSFQDEIKHTVDDYAIVKTWVSRIADEKKDIHKANKSNSPRPGFIIDTDFPGVYIAGGCRYFRTRLGLTALFRKVEQRWIDLPITL